MSSSFARLFLLAASVTPALAFCGSRTHLDKRAVGEVEVNEFGYAGTIVGFPPPTKDLCP